MHSYIIFFPLLVPLVSAVLSIGFWGDIKVQQRLCFFGAAVTVVSSVVLLWVVGLEGIIYVQVGNWKAPVGITLVADLLSAIMVLIAAIINLVIFIYATGSLDKLRLSFGFYPMVMLLVFGVMGSFLTGDVFNLYVWFEVMLMASFVLITLGGTKNQVEGAIKYVSINFVASAVFLAGVGILYGTAGTLNMADLAVKLPLMENSGLVSLAAVFFLLCFGIKAAIFPLYFWLPASYHTPHITVAALIAGLLTKVGVYAMIRFFTLIFTKDVAFTHTLLLYAAVFTMVFGVLGAIIQNDFRKILSFHIVSQIGYMILGLALYTPLAIAGAIFFIIHNMLTKTNLFLICGISYMVNESYHLKDLGSIYKKFPVVALCFTISAFSLVGIPPLSGFLGKFILARAGMASDYYWVVAIIFGVSILTLFSMLKIWAEAFLKKKKSTDIERYQDQGSFIKDQPFILISVITMCILILYIGIFPDQLIAYSQKAANQLLDTRSYINTVLEKKTAH